MSFLNRGALIGAACALALLLASLIDPGLFGLENLLGDRITRFVARRTPPDPNIVIVAINDKSVQSLEKPEAYGRWPWSREVMARVVEEAQAAGARAVVFDVSFTGQNATDPSGDDRFAAALRSMPVVVAAQTSDGRPLAWSSDFDRLLIQGTRTAAPTRRLITPDAKFLPAAIGTMRLEDARRYAAVDRVSATQSVPSLALAAASVITRRPITMAGDDIRLGASALPLDAAGNILIRWHATQAEKAALNYPAIDLDKVIVASLMREEGASDAELAAFGKQLSGKILIVGATAQGLLDLRATPLSPTSAGVEIHANALDSILHGDFNRPAAPWLVALLLLASCAALGLLLFRIDSYIADFLVAASFALLWLTGSGFALFQRWVIPSAGPLLAIGLTWIAVTIVSYIAEKKRGVQLKATFGRYVSPQILDHILTHPEKIELGGDRRDMSILFSDIRGFTSISEASEPEEVVEMLNEYLTEMVEILLRHGGTLDKFIGDAVMGFWNAPADDPHHAEHAVACAVEMIEATTRIRERWEPVGKAAIRIGIGINSGEAVVGNIGSNRVQSYTVIGDAVNLASRLESKNKDYGTEIIISEMTLDRLSKSFETSYLDEVKVKGKENAVKIYEVKGRL